MMSGDQDRALTNEHTQHLNTVKDGSEFLRVQIDDGGDSAITLPLADRELALFLTRRTI